MHLLNIRQVNPDLPEPGVIEEAAGIIRKGGVVVFPTSSLYGLAADAFNPDAIEKLFDLKDRSHEKAILVLISEIRELSTLVKSVPPEARRLIEHFWPGGLTLVLEAKPDLPSALTAGSGKIGVRLCRHPVAAALAKAAGCPITGTSANLSGAGGCDRISRLDTRIAEKADLILDAGVLKGGIGSTVADMAGGFPKILREGTVLQKDIFVLLADLSRNCVDKQG
ncbi:MAG: L-threonylcarbamoyladenylate synthase [Desulfobacterales bacterium]